MALRCRACLVDLKVNIAMIKITWLLFKRFDKEQFHTIFYVVFFMHFAHSYRFDLCQLYHCENPLLARSEGNRNFDWGRDARDGS